MPSLPAAPPVFVAPENPDAPIWRYMDFTSFVAMLEYQGIFFPRADHVSDPYEGAITRASEEYRRRLRLELRKQGVKLAAREFRELDALYARVRSVIFISAWHVNRYESAAMWAQYGPARGSVAIQSTYRKLREALGSRVHIGMVRYISTRGQSSPAIDPLWRFMYKRKSFEHERELRAVIANFAALARRNARRHKRRAEAPDWGVWRRADLNRLIDSVRIAPSSPSWLVDLARRITRTYGLRKPVRQSVLDQDPFVG